VVYLFYKSTSFQAKHCRSLAKEMGNFIFGISEWSENLAEDEFSVVTNKFGSEIALSVLFIKIRRSWISNVRLKVKVPVDLEFNLIKDVNYDEVYDLPELAVPDVVFKKTFKIFSNDEKIFSKLPFNFLKSLQESKYFYMLETRSEYLSVDFKPTQFSLIPPKQEIREAAVEVLKFLAPQLLEKMSTRVNNEQFIHKS